jgi:hypothetical protein
VGVLEKFKFAKNHLNESFKGPTAVSGAGRGGIELMVEVEWRLQGHTRPSIPCEIQRHGVDGKPPRATKKCRVEVHVECGIQNVLSAIDVAVSCLGSMF